MHEMLPVLNFEETIHLNYQDNTFFFFEKYVKYLKLVIILFFLSGCFLLTYNKLKYYFYVDFHAFYFFSYSKKYVTI